MRNALSKRLPARRLTQLLAAACAASASACGVYAPTPAERIHVIDSPVDTYKCQRLAVLDGTVATSPGFGDQLDVMLERTAALGGTDLYLRRRSRDWSYVQGIAYRCSDRRDVPIIVHRTVISTKG